MSLFRRGKELKQRLSKAGKKEAPTRSSSEGGDGNHNPLVYLKDLCLDQCKTRRLDDGTELKGRFKDGRLNGQGTMTFPSGKVYKGGFKEGRFHGQGTLVYPSGTKYVGRFKENRRHGQGVMCFSNGFRYVGQFRDNRSNGYGKLTFPDGTWYEGQFRDGRFHGQGVMRFANGARYEGRFHRDRRHGHGSMTFPNGFRYTGQFHENRSHGHGTLTFPDGTTYDGGFKEDKCDGHGIITYTDGTRYEGQFVNDRYNGQGRLTFPDGTVYEGGFRNDRYHGYGVLTRPDGRRESGRFVDGRIEGTDAPQSVPAPARAVGDIKDGRIAPPPPHGAEKRWFSGAEGRRDLRGRPAEPERHTGAGRHRAADGHYVASKGEILVDNWLYMFGIVHVYHKRLAVEEPAFATFYLPKGNVHLECWSDGADANQIQEKIDVYHRNGLDFIGLSDDDIHHLDEVLPGKLLPFGIRVH